MCRKVRRLSLSIVFISFVCACTRTHFIARILFCKKKSLYSVECVMRVCMLEVLYMFLRKFLRGVKAAAHAYSIYVYLCMCVCLCSVPCICLCEISWEEINQLRTLKVFTCVYVCVLHSLYMFVRKFLRGDKAAAHAYSVYVCLCVCVCVCALCLVYALAKGLEG
jgi:hypothetical protein